MASRRRISRRAAGAGLLLLLLLLGSLEAYRAYTFYSNLVESRDILLQLKGTVDLSSLSQTEPEVREKQTRLAQAGAQLNSARSFADSDLLLAITGVLPGVGKQANSLKYLVRAADDSSKAGIQAANVALAFSQFQRQPDETSTVAALRFLRSQEETMANVSTMVSKVKTSQSHIAKSGLIGPLQRANKDLDDSLGKLSGLVDGYGRANNFLPELLGYQSRKSYLLLPQNDTELFPSGGLMSSYAVAVFDNGTLTSVNLEYFGDLFDRWQLTSKGEYVEPPAPLKNYLLHQFSWGLGEAGWYPDFPTSAGLAQGFVAKGGVPSTDGTIAIDMQFLISLLDVTGPVDLPTYGVTVTPANAQELALELTRGEDYNNGQTHQAFLSTLAQALLGRLFATPKDRWITMLQLLDRLGKERHLQMNFNDPSLQALSTAYGFDGAIVSPPGTSDFLLVADTSVNSTKLNLILKPTIQVNSILNTDGSVRSLLIYQIENPFPDWRIGRDPNVVGLLMLDGVYGSYTRVYTGQGAKLIDVRLDGSRVGAEQNNEELGKPVFGRYFRVLPGASANIQFLYVTPTVISRDSDGYYHYELYIQKEPGTKAVPVQLNFTLPAGGQLTQATLDGKAVSTSGRIDTDLLVDRRVELTYKLSQ